MMKNPLTLLLCLTITAITVVNKPAEAQWVKVFTGNNLTCLAVVNADTVLAAGDNVMVRTFDGGATWQNIFPAGLTFNALDMEIAGNSIFACGEGKILKTTDLGDTWDVVYESPTATFQCLSFAGENYGMVFFHGVTDTLMTTSDGGQNWATLPFTFSTDNVECSIEMTDKTTAYIAETSYLASKLYKTIDGGLTWNLLSFPDNMGALGGPIAFTSNDRGIIGSGMGVYLTKDGGSNWITIGGFPIGSYVWIYPLVSGSVYVCGFDWMAGGGPVRFTNDEGATWKSQYAGNKNEDIQMADDSIGYFISGSFNTTTTEIYKTIHGGFIWGGVEAHNYAGERLFELLPNPAHDRIKISSLKAGDFNNINLEISTVYGAVVINVNTAPGTYTDISGLVPGLYLYRISLDNKTVQSGKIVKQ
ncbi:MAG TPA: T9SS type A sorting domain-containing protein [Bacteroidales bacterium]|nr:T9SS type A sorting domain-containing protein [Bacteroidales bacterium]